MWSKKVLQPIYFYRKRITIVAFITILSLLFLNLITPTKINSAVASGNGDKLLTIFEDGKRFSFKTSAKTVREALAEQKISLEEHDHIEPSLNDELDGVEYNINIYRAMPVIIKDNNYKVKVLSSSKVASKIVSDAGIKLYDEDKVELIPSTNPAEDGTSTVLNITRAKLVKVDLYGKETEFRTRAATVADFLKEKNIKLEEQDGISVEKTEKISNGQHFRIWRNGKQTITNEEDVDFEVEKIKDSEKEAGYKQVKEAGEKGKKTVTYEIEMQNGKEVSRKKINESQTKAPKKQIEVVGSKQASLSYTGDGNKTEWLSASNIPQSEWGYADWLVSKESGWNPNSTNRSSGACGLAQALPCSKVGADPYNPVNSLNWMNNYVMRRYGSWANAVNHSKTKGWY